MAPMSAYLTFLRTSSQTNFSRASTDEQEMQFGEGDQSRHAADCVSRPTQDSTVDQNTRHATLCSGSKYDTRNLPARCKRETLHTCIEEYPQATVPVIVKEFK